MSRKPDIGQKPRRKHGSRRRPPLTAQFSLALVYDLGEGVAEDDEAAARYYAQAARQGHVTRYNLGLAYDEGTGVDENDETAVSWYRRAAKQGDMNRNLILA